MPFSQQLRDIFAELNIEPERIAANIQPGTAVTIDGQPCVVIGLKDAPATLQQHTDWTHSLFVRHAKTNRQGIVTYRPDTGEVGLIGWFSNTQSDIRLWVDVRETFLYGFPDQQGLTQERMDEIFAQARAHRNQEQ
jgi:hypothetical protein